MTPLVRALFLLYTAASAVMALIAGYSWNTPWLDWPCTLFFGAVSVLFGCGAGSELSLMLERR